MYKRQNNAGFFVESTQNIHSEINVNWTSDGSIISFDIPDQALTVVKTSDVGEETAAWENVSKTALSSEAVTDADGNESIHVSFEVSSLFNGIGTNSGVSLSDFIENDSHYTLKVELDGASFSNVVGSTDLDNFTFMFDTASNVTTLSAETVRVREDVGVVEVVVNLSNPLTEDFTLDYVTLGGDQFNAYQYAAPGEDFQESSGQVIIPAGNTQATITIDIFSEQLKISALMVRRMEPW